MLNFLYGLWIALGLVVPRFSRISLKCPKAVPVLKFWLKYIYPFLIFLLIIVPPVLLIIDFAQTLDRSLIPLFFFDLIIPVQYIFGYLYAKKQHFDSVYADIHRSRLHGESTYRHMPKNLTIVLIIISLTVISTIVSGVLFGLGHPPEGFDLLLNRFGYHWFLITSLVIHWTYSWAILITNLFIFIYVFSKHLKDIRALEAQVAELIWKMDQSQIGALGRNIVGLRYTLNQSVDNLQDFYTSMTLLGAIGIGAVIEYKVVDLYAIFYIVVYGLLQLTFLYFIYQISERRQDILKSLKSPSLLFKYLTNVQCMNNIEALRRQDLSLEELEGLRISAYCPVTYSQIAPMIDSPNNPGNNNEPQEEIKGPNGPSVNSPADIENISESHMNLDSSYPSKLERSNFEILALAYKNNAAMDWMILNSLLADQWAEFSLFGISFSDTEVIKKSMGLISVVIVFSTFINSLTVQ